MSSRMHLKNRSAMPRPYVIGLACFLASCPLGDAQSQSPEDRVDQIFKDFRSDTPGCAVGVIKDGKIIYARGYGMADLDHNIRITPSTVFYTASLAKQFTAMSILLLAERDKALSLDDEMTKYVPELRVNKPVKIRDLLNHTSGIRDHYALITMAGWHLYDDLVTRDHVIELAQRVKSMDFDPGRDFLYNNTGYTIAGLIVERVTGGKSLSKFADENIFRPLGMKSTVLAETHRQIVLNRAYGYRKPPKSDRPFEQYMPNLDLTGPTNLYTTVEDLASWIRNFEDKVVGGERVISQMQTRGRLANGAPLDYGLGLWIGTYGGHSIFEHDGRHAGYRAHMLHFPTQRFAVTCLCNEALAENNLPHRLTRLVADIYLQSRIDKEPVVQDTAPSATVKETAPASAELAQYTGRYYSDEINTTYTVEQRDSSLVILRPRYPATDLTRQTGDLFRIENFSQPLTSATMRFTRNQQSQEISGFNFTGRRRGELRILDFHFGKKP